MVQEWGVSKRSKVGDWEVGGVSGGLVRVEWVSEGGVGVVGEWEASRVKWGWSGVRDGGVYGLVVRKCGE